MSYYDLLGVRPGASAAEIKKAFREKAKRLHPDIAGAGGTDAMRKLLAAYEALSDTGRRLEYDRIYERFAKRDDFDYRAWLNEQGNPESQAKLVLFELLHLEEERAIEIWKKNGGLDFRLEKYFEREDWLDCIYILAEELDKNGFSYEAFRLLAVVLTEEGRRPYFKHFTQEIETYIKTLVRLRLKPQVDRGTWIECLKIMISLDFPQKDKNRWMRSIEDAVNEDAVKEAAKKDTAGARAKAVKKKSGQR